MEATPKTSRKRKQTSSTSQVHSPFTGALTRQKSQKYFFNRNRSGKSRKCRFFQHPSSQLPPITQPQSRVDHASSGGNGGDDDDEEYHISIKDLRARRVFSTPPEKQILGKVENPRFDSDLIDCSDGFGENPSFSIGEKSGSGVGLNGGNPNLSMLKKCDLEVNLKSDDSDSDSDSGENEKLGVSIDISDMLEKCDDLLDSMIGCSRRRNPNLSVSSEKCESVIECGSPNLSVPNKCDETRVGFKGDGFNGGNPNLSVLKKCSSMVGVGSTNLVVSAKCDDSRVDFVDEGLNGGVLNQEISSEKCESVVNGEDSNVVGSVNSGKANSLEKCGICLDDISPNSSDKDEKSRVGGNCVVVNEENELTTPPNAVVLSRRCDELNVLQSRSSVSRSLSNQISTSKDGSVEGKNYSNTKKDMTLKRCSRQKVFKVPNSFSYRRLLPYLMDIAKDDPCELEVNSTVKSAVDVEAKPVVSSSHESVTDGSKLNGETLDTMAASVSQEESIDSKDEQSLDSKASNPSAEVAAVPIAANCSAVGSGIGSQHDLKPVLSQDENISSDDLGKLGDFTSTGERSTAAALYSPEASRNLSSDLESPCNLSVVAVGDCRAADIRVPNGEIPISKCNGSSKLAAVVSSGAPVVGLANGILKKNPRGCRGICSCLNCASFRLNAEKAFEFSRNQLLEAEELAKDLMMEISSLRCMLEKSVTGATEAKILPDNQVHEACRRACNVEDMARSRLSQMNEDLFVHCRTKALQRPRVNFSGYIQEKAIRKLTKQKDKTDSSESAGMNGNLK